MNCGRCVEVSCTDPTCSGRPSEIVYILDQCPGCGYGGLDLSPEVFESITGQSYTILPIQWKFVDCPVSNNVEYCLKTGSSEFWVAVQPTNLVSGVQSMTINDQKASRVDSAFYFLIDGHGENVANLDSVKISMTSVKGEVLEDTLSMTANKCTTGSSQFSSTGNTYQTTISAPVSTPTIAVPTYAPTATTVPATESPTVAPTTDSPPLAPPPNTYTTGPLLSVTEALMVPPPTNPTPTPTPAPLQRTIAGATTTTQSLPSGDNLVPADQGDPTYHRTGTTESAMVSSIPRAGNANEATTQQATTLLRQSRPMTTTPSQPTPPTSETSVRDQATRNRLGSTTAIVTFVATVCVTAGIIVGLVLVVRKKRKLLEACKSDDDSASEDSLESHYAHVSTPNHEALMMSSGEECKRF